MLFKKILFAYGLLAFSAWAQNIKEDQKKTAIDLIDSVHWSGKTLIISSNSVLDEILLFNASLHKIASHAGSNTEIHLGLQALPTGVYLLKVRSGPTSTARLIVVK
ncbi:MAG: T9SS type A sorting domain-containing protein [Fibromonadaceae bacterium]|jgi:hypothetical protein|nr:T9SS type A sorting domain-containing protein [Fibromonadaceae bacterium]